MRRLIRFLICFVFLSGPALSQDITRAGPDLRPIEGADETWLTAAQGGEPQSVFNYVIPIYNNPGSTEDQRQAAIRWLTWGYGLYDLQDTQEMVDAAEAALYLAYFESSLNSHGQAIGWAGRCITPLQDRVEEERVGYIVARCLEVAAVSSNELSRYEDGIQFSGLARRVYRYLSEINDGYRIMIANALMVEANGLDGVKRHREAIALSTQALDIYEEFEGPEGPSVANIVVNIGASYWYLKDLQPARDWSLRALPLVDLHAGRFSSPAAVVRINLGLIAQDMGRPKEAMKWAIEVLPFIAANPRTSLSHQRWNFELLRNLFAAEGQIEKAVLFGKMAVNAQQEIRALNQFAEDEQTEGLREEWRRLYQGLADLLIGEGRFSEAQAVLNMEKEQEAFEFLQRDAEADLRETRAILTDTETGDAEKLTALAERPVAAYAAWEALSRKLDAGEGTEADEDRLFLLEDALAEAEAAYAAGVDAFLMQVAPDRRAGFSTQFDATGAYQAILRERARPSAILQVAMLDDTTHLFLTLPGATVHEEVAVGRTEMRRRVFEMLQAMEARSPEAVTHLQGLYDVLFAPIRPALETAGTQVVMVNADDVLRYVPFAALHDGDGYLVENYAFALYIAAVQTQFGQPERDAASAAGFGVTRAYDGFAALPGVAAEMETLFTASDGVGVLAGKTWMDQAFDVRMLRRTLRKPPQMLHIASHFALRPGRDEDSFLLLGDGSRLSLSELRTSRFRFAGVDLLTLSACQTARGGDGSEIDGFGAAALMGGASAVMASLWPVADAATPELMADFYAGLLERGEDKAEALRQAQIAMLRGSTVLRVAAADRAAAPLEEDAPDAPPAAAFSHPYFWSAFILMGNWL